MLIKIKNLTKVYNQDGNGTQVLALNNVSLETNKGEFIAIMGPSGSGKSTLMNIIGCLDKPTSGSYLLERTDVSKLSEEELAKIRNKRIGFVFQSFNLIPRLNTLRNVEVPLIYSREDEDKIRERALKALKQVSLISRAGHLPSQLSGGEKQRVAIARALVNNPSIVLADEPTGNLDSKTGKEIMEVFKELNSLGVTIILVTHEKEIASYAQRMIYFRDGRIENQTERTTSTQSQNYENKTNIFKSLLKETEDALAPIPNYSFREPVGK